MLLRSLLRDTQRLISYKLYLIGADLFTDKTKSQVQFLYLTLLDTPWEITGYNCGSTALGYLYRRLCGAFKKNVKEIAGPLIILQVILIFNFLFLNMFVWLNVINYVYIS